MKKLLIIISVNILLFGIVFIVSEYTIYKAAVSEYVTRSEASKYIPYPSFFKSYTTPFYAQTAQFDPKNEQLWIRGTSFPDENVSEKKPPILMFGCSFAHGGYFLKNNQTASYKLSQLTKRTVYNFAMCGCGIQHMFMFIQKYLDENMPANEKPDYAVYVYIPNQIQRLRADIFPGILYSGTVLHYKPAVGFPAAEKSFPPLLSRSYIIKKLLYLRDRKREENITQKRYDDFAVANELFLASRCELQRKYPGIKFVILRYEIENDDDYREAPFMWTVLKEEGFTVINSSDLIGRKFVYHSEDTAGDFYHPSEKAWDMLLPELIKKLSL